MFSFLKSLARNIALIFYYSICCRLPNSAFPLGRWFNGIRVFFAKMIIPIGRNCKVQKNVYIGSGKNIQVGNNCQINDNVRLVNAKIGNDVMIGRECIFIGGMHEFSDTKIPMMEQGGKCVKPTIVEDDVWIGLRVIIMPGVRIKKGTIIGAGSVVTKSTKPYGIYVGIPANLIKKRENN